MNNCISISNFSFYRAPASSVRRYKDIGLADAYNYIVGSYARERTERLRTIDDEKRRREFKGEMFDFVTFSGTFGYRNDQGLLQHSGQLCIDIDHLDRLLLQMRQRLLDDPYFDTLMLFVSPSGTGLKWVVPIDLQKADHRTWFRAVSNYLAATYGVEADPSCINVSRACFLPYDPDCYIHPDCRPAVQQLAVPPHPALPSQGLSDEDFATLKRSIDF